jgi:hypothetical protein
MRNLFSHVKKYLLTDDLGGEESLREVGQHVRGKQRRSFRQIIFEQLDQAWHIVTSERGDRHYLREPVQLAILFDEGESLLFGYSVHLVDDEEHGHPDFPNQLQHMTIAAAGRVGDIDHEDNEIDATQAGDGTVDHEAIQLILGLVNPGRIEEDDLRTASIRDG